MRQSQIFFKTNKESPKNEESINAKLLTRAGFIYKNSAGVYSFLPLGLKVISKISNIIREEMNAIGGQEILMATLHDKHYLKTSGRWDIDVLYKVISQKYEEPTFNISWTHEEVVAEIVKHYISSYKDLPFSLYQIQTKFRREKRAKSGLLRGREFLMKDLYSFHTSNEDLMRFYNIVAKSYKKIFERCGLKTVYTLAPGGDFTSQYTHEFQVICEAGEDTIFVCEKCGYAENEEISRLENGKRCFECGGVVRERKSIEVGNIFPLGNKYSTAFNLKFVDGKGERKYVIMGSYGIGITRTMGTIVELYHDERGITWPLNVAPFRVHLIPIEFSSTVEGVAEKLYTDLQKRGIEVLYDDRIDRTAGEKLVDADLIGLPFRIVVSQKLLKTKVIEVKKRNENKIKLIKIKDVWKNF